MLHALIITSYLYCFAVSRWKSSLRFVFMPLVSLSCFRKL
jgi:hypothetical protein